MIRPKTPEEIAEMERKRRIRMEEEAKKWNVAPEDLPEDILAGEEFEVFDEGDYDEEEDIAEEDDSDDIIDLD